MPNTLIVAERLDRTDFKRRERLCITRGDVARYRIYLSVRDDLTARVDDLDPYEFNSTDDIGLSRFLVESLWRLTVTPSSLVKYLSALDSPQ